MTDTANCTYSLTQTEHGRGSTAGQIRVTCPECGSCRFPRDDGRFPNHRPNKGAYR